MGGGGIILSSLRASTVIVIRDVFVHPSMENDRCSDQTITVIGMQLMGHLANGEFERAHALLGEQMRAAMSSEELEDAWNGIISTKGQLQGLSGTRCEEEGGFRAVHLTCGFSSGSMVDVKLVFRDAEEVLGLWFHPQDPVYRVPDYVDEGAFSEKDVGVGEHSLPGKVTVPEGEGPFPAVLLVHGSGPNDMDETLWETKVFRDLAWGLSSDGVVVLRYDKRPRARPDLFEGDFTIMDEVVDDAVEGLRMLMSMDEVDADRVFVLGHSLGGMMVPRIASIEGRVAGLILMAGDAGHLEDAFLEQIEYLVNLDGVIDENEAALLEETRETVTKIKELDIAEGEMVLGAGRAYWEDLNAYDQLSTAAELERPFLVLQGERDYQVTMDDLEAWREVLAGKDATFLSYPKLNHMMIAGEGTSTPQEYTLPGNLSREVVEDILDWIGDL